MGGRASRREVGERGGRRAAEAAALQGTDSLSAVVLVANARARLRSWFHSVPHRPSKEPTHAWRGREARNEEHHDVSLLAVGPPRTSFSSSSPESWPRCNVPRREEKKMFCDEDKYYS